MLDVVQLRIGNLHVTEALLAKLRTTASGQSGSYKGPINKVKDFLKKIIRAVSTVEIQ
jgi:hypothetical protein